MTYKREEGFTLIELLVVIGIIGILAAIVLVAVNPGRQFAQARNTTRKSDIIGFTTAIYAFAADHNGNLPGTDDTTTVSNFPIAVTEIGSCATCFNLAVAGDVDGNSDGVDEPIAPTYIASLPTDPSGEPAAGDSGYSIYLDAATSRITAAAPEAELGEVISVTR